MARRTAEGEGLPRGLSALCMAVAAIVVGTGCSAGSGMRQSDYSQALALVDRGTVLLRNRAFEEADAVFALAYEFAPISPALDGRGCVAMMKGDFDSAERYFVEAYNSDRTYDEALGNLALLYELRGDSEGAKRLYEMFLSSHPESAAARHNLAALEYDKARAGGPVSEGEKARLRAEIVKSAAMADHAVIFDNMQRLNGDQGL